MRRAVGLRGTTGRNPNKSLKGIETPKRDLMRPASSIGRNPNKSLKGIETFIRMHRDGRGAMVEILINP